MPCAIRSARTAGDAPAIARVRVDSWRSTYRGMIPDAYLDGMQVEASTALWDRVLTAGPNTTCVFVAEHGTDVVGFSCGQPACRSRSTASTPSSPRSTCAASSSAPASAGGSSAPSRRPSARMRRPGLITWVIAGNKPARAFYEGLGGELIVEQPFQWDGMDLVEAGYGWRDLVALAAACAVAVVGNRNLREPGETK